MASVTFLDRVRFTIHSLDTPKHGLGGLVVGDDGLVPRTGVIREAPRLDSVQELELQPVDVDLLLGVEDGGVNVDPKAGAQLSLSAASLRAFDHAPGKMDQLLGRICLN